MLKQFAFGLCGLLRKSKLSLVSMNSMVLKVTSGSLGEAGRSLWNYCMLRIWGAVLRYPCVEPAGGSGFLLSLIASCNELWWLVVRWLRKFSELTVCLDVKYWFAVQWTIFTYLKYILHKNILLFTVWWSSKFVWGGTVPSILPKASQHKRITYTNCCI